MPHKKLSPKQCFRLKQLLDQYNRYRNALGISQPNETVWFSENDSRRYEAVADGVGGGSAIVYEGNPCDAVSLYKEHFDNEDDAVTAIQIQAKAGGAWEDEHDETRGVTARDEL